MRRNAWFCKACQKQAYPSQSRAERTVEHIQSINPDGRTPKRAYECPYGNGWHLTSKELRRETA